MHITPLDGQTYLKAGLILRFLPIWGERETINKWIGKWDGWTYKGAAGVQCPLIYIYNCKTSIFKQQNDSIPPLDGRTLSKSLFDLSNIWLWPNQRHESVLEGPTNTLWVFINIFYTTVRNDQYTSMQVMPYYRLATKYCLKVGLIVRSWPDLRLRTTNNWLQKYDRGPYLYCDYLSPCYTPKQW